MFIKKKKKRSQQGPASEPRGSVTAIISKRVRFDRNLHWKLGGPGVGGGGNSTSFGIFLDF